MDTIELKKSFHTLIDEIENEFLLEEFYQEMKVVESNSKSRIWHKNI
jgi:hypothetical protein